MRQNKKQIINGNEQTLRENVALKWGNVFSVVDYICVILLALCPLLQHYKGPLYNAAISVLVILVPYLFFRVFPMLRNFKLADISLVFVIIIYQIYRVIDHGTTITEFGQSSVFIIYMVVLVLGIVDTKFFLKVITCVAVLASLFLVIQYLLFYIFKVHLQLVPTSLLLPTAEQWVLGAQTGLVGITGRPSDFYRPSAFFLEPSHFFIYSFPTLFINLFINKIKKENLAIAITVTVGMILSTSGMGMAVTAFAWVLWFALRNEEAGSFNIKNVFRKRNLVALGIIAVLLILSVIFVPSIQRTVLRIFTSKTGSTAITGRIAKAFKLVAGMTPLQWIFGVADNTHGIGFNVPGFFDALYRHGLIGLVLSFEFYVKSVFKAKRPFALIAIVIIGVSLFSAHTHSTVGMLYFILILMSGYRKNSDNEFIILSRRGNSIHNIKEKKNC